MEDFKYLLDGLKCKAPGDAYMEFLHIIDPKLKHNINSLTYLTCQLKTGYYPSYNEFLKYFSE